MILLIIFYYIGYWKLFKKMDNKGWECLLPIYNEYLLCKKININKVLTIIYLIVKGIVLFFGSICLFYLIFLLIMGFHIQLLVLTGYFEMATINRIFVKFIIFILFFMIYIVIRGYVIYKGSLMFGKSKNSAIIFGIFSFIGVMILGFDNSVYDKKVLDR